MTAKTLMIIGSMSSVGKSLLTTALCRIFSRKGFKVAPFKAQNLSKNLYICANGIPIARAQAFQAVAAGLEPDVLMNPVLLKPKSDSSSEIILMGKPWDELQANSSNEKKEVLWQQITQAVDTLRLEHDLVIVEGAGSPVELNLKHDDLVNMSVASYLKAPTLLVGNMERGGIFAQIMGTLGLMTQDEQNLVKGLVINKFHGKVEHFNTGVSLLEEKSRKPVVGILPFFKNLLLPYEGTQSLMNRPPEEKHSNDLDIAIISLPQIASFDEFDALRHEKGVHVRFVNRFDHLGIPDAIIIPGSESVVSDLTWMRENRLASAVVNFAKQGGTVMGICGGYQILGQTIADPDHIESEIDLADGLGLLPSRTVFRHCGTNSQTIGQLREKESLPEWLASLAGTTLKGFEIHRGQTETDSPWLEYTARNRQSLSVPDGAIGEDGNVLGCYLHSIFSNDTFRHAWLRQLGWKKENASAYNLENTINWLADQVEANLDLKLLEEMIWSSS